MSLKRYATRRDQSEPEILRAISKIGARYILLDKIDALVLFRGRVYMFEHKTPKKGRKTRNQDALVQDGWPLHFVTSPDQAIEILTKENS